MNDNDHDIRKFVQNNNLNGADATSEIRGKTCSGTFVDVCLDINYFFAWRFWEFCWGMGSSVTPHPPY